MVDVNKLAKFLADNPDIIEVVSRLKDVMEEEDEDADQPYISESLSKPKIKTPKNKKKKNTSGSSPVESKLVPTEVIPNIVVSKEPKKRGRPKKDAPKPTKKNDKDDFIVRREEVTQEDEEESDEETGETAEEQRGVRSRVSPISKQRPPNKFKIELYASDSEVKAARKFDEQYVYTAKPAPRTRPAAKKIKVRCRGCGRSEKIFQSYLLSVEDSSGFLCNRCSTGRA